MKLVIPCAGRGTRLGLDIPKALIPINGRTLLGHITHQWSDIVDGFVIVVSEENEQLLKQHSGNAEFIVQEPLRGIADAILQAEQCVKDRFVVELGDCFYSGVFREPGRFVQGVGVWKTKNLVEVNKSYLVDIKGDLVERVTEKPSLHPADVDGYLNCGMGTYFLDARVFNYIRETPPSVLRNEVEITDVVQNMIDAGERISPVWFEGRYINLTYPEDLRKAEEIF